MTKPTKELQDYIIRRLNLHSNSSFKSYMENRDKAYDRLTDTKSEFVMPLVLSQVDSARAKLVNLFVANEPIFEVISPQNLIPVAEQYTAIYEDDSHRYGWKSQLSTAFLDGLKYNLMAVEVIWNIEQTASKTEEGTNIIYQGNLVRRIDLYNAFWDTNPEPNQLHKEGDYAGYVEQKTPLGLDRLFTQLEVPTDLQEQAYQASSTSRYYNVNLRKEEASVSAEESAIYFDLTDSQIGRHKKYSKHLNEVVTMYSRLIPADFNLSDVANANTQSIFKLVLVNDILVHVEELTNKHNYLPILFCTAKSDGLKYETKSFSECLESLQEVSTTLVIAEIKSNRRMLTDRAIYDPTLISKRDINSPNPSAKIPLRASAIGRGVNEAYQSIPYSDPAMGYRIQQATGLLSFGNEISGLNQVQQGQFVKGNKTNDQFQESMASSGQRMLSLAIGIEDTLMSAIKEITKQNILQYQPVDRTLSAVLGREVTINPEELKTLIPKFKVTDGLLSADRLANTEMMMMAMQMMPAIPELTMQYNVPKMFTHMLSLKGLRGLDQYLLTPEEMKAKQDAIASANTGQVSQPPA